MLHPKTVSGDLAGYSDCFLGLHLSSPPPLSPRKGPSSHWCGNYELNLLGDEADSRYRHDFEELELIGRGGFGAVMKVYTPPIMSLLIVELGSKPS